MALRVSCLVTLLALAACSTVIKGSSQQISVRTPGADGAQCYVTTDDGDSYFVRTPGIIVVKRRNENLRAHCRKAGYRDGLGIIRPGVDGTTLGNVANAGLGLGVDAISGAINEYPEIVYVHMARAKDDFISFLTVGGAARWVGQGVRDACGVPWSADLRLNAGVVSGSVWRGQVEYIVGGRPDPKGHLSNAPATRNSTSFGRPGPRFIRVNFYFNVDEVSGSYAIDENGQLLCTTPVVLKRSAV